MFVETSFQVLNSCLTIVQFILVLSVGRVLMVYSRYGGAYASSIRWTHQGGFIDMLQSSVGSYAVPRKIRYTMAAVLVVTLASNLSSIIMSRFIHQSQQLGKPVQVFAISDQYIPRSTSFVLAAWTAYTRGNAADALLSMVNSPSNIPHMKNNSVYNIHRSEYDVGCQSMDLSYNLSIIEHSPNSCMTVEVVAGSVLISEMSNMQLLRKGSGRGSISMDVKAGPIYTELSLFMLLTYGKVSCGLVDLVGNILDFPINGTTSAPTTTTTKCWTASGEMMVISMTTLRFSSNVDSIHRTATSLIGESPLFHEVEQQVLNATDTNSTDTVGNIEYMVVGPSFEFSGCLRGLRYMSSVPMAICSYNTASIIVSKSHQYNSTMSSAFGSVLNGSSVATIATIKHLPANHTLVPFDIRNASYSVADLVASFGFNLIVDWAHGRCLLDTTFVFRRTKPKPMLTTFNLENDLELDGGKITYLKELPTMIPNEYSLENSTAALVVL